MSDMVAHAAERFYRADQAWLRAMGEDDRNAVNEAKARREAREQELLDEVAAALRAAAGAR